MQGRVLNYSVDSHEYDYEEFDLQRDSLDMDHSPTINVQKIQVNTNKKAGKAAVIQHKVVDFNDLKVVGSRPM